MIVGKLHETIRQAYKRAYSAEPPKFEILPTKPVYGDFSTNIAIVAASSLGMSPVMAAQKITAQMGQTNVFRDISVSSPGFINFTVTDSHLLEVVAALIKSPDSFGRSDLGKETRVLVEFVSANPTGPLTLANGRGAFVGEAISRVLELYGCTVMREYYVNDRGGQIEALGHSVLKDDKKEYAGKYIDELAKRIKEKDPQAAGEQASSIIMEEMIKPTLRQLGIEFHQFFSEKSLYQTGVAKQVMDILKARDIVFEADGCTWLETTRFGDDKDRVLIRSTGEETYLASDIAYHAYKVQRGYHRLINVVGADHYTYTRELSMVVDGVLRDYFTWGGQFEWVVTQLVKLIEKGKEVTMSKRTGTYVPLDELLSEVGPDVTRFFFLSKSTDSHLNFDMDLAKSTSSQNPVYYIQYAYARISSIFRQYSKSDDFSLPEKIKLTHPLERRLLIRILQFPDLVEEVAGDLQVHKLAHYVFGLATELHHFYEQLRVLGEETEVTLSRLAILKAASLTIKRSLDVMGISAPSRMVKETEGK